MKRAAFSILAVMMFTTLLAVPPAHANGTAQCKSMTISVVNLPDVCPTGVTMEGKLVIWLAGDEEKGQRLVLVRVTAATPFGDVAVYKTIFRMTPGTERSIELPIPVGYDGPLGVYTLDVNVTVKGGESLTVQHEVEVTPGR